MKSILYAEDREDDVFFFRRACRRAGLDGSVRLHAVGDGRLAIAYLSGEKDYADRAKHPSPDLVLLDLKMPHKSGLEVLEWIRAQPQFAELPVFLLTSSNQQSDIQAASALKANGYFIKPTGIDEFAPMVNEIAAAMGLTGAQPAVASR